MAATDPNIQYFESIRDRCKSDLPQLASWSGYFNRRHAEFLTYYELMPQKHWGKVLEIGAGNGFNAAFLSKISDSVISTDLPDPDATTHTPGLELARNTLKALDVHNVEVEAASANDLPYEDNSFDMVFSSHVIEHVPNNAKAIEEIHRVLKPGGINFMVIPTRTSHFYGIFAYWSHWIPVIFRKLRGKKVGTEAAQASAAGSSEAAHVSTNRGISRFLHPGPHGHTPTFGQELRTWSPRFWRKLVTANGKWPMKKQATTQINPLLPLLGELFPNVAVASHIATRGLERSLGQQRIFFPLGINTLIITQKPLED